MSGLLVLLAHPDDEFFCGGLLSALTARDVPVHLVYWTRGEGGGSPRARLFWQSFPAAWSPRVREARRVASLLRVSSVSFLGSIDPAPDPDLRAPDDEVSSVIEKLSRLRALHAPDLLLTHGSQGDYGHPAHRRLHEIAREFSGSGPLVTFNAAWPGSSDASFINTADLANFIFDAQPYLEIKRKIVLAYRSQKGVFESLAGGPLDQLLHLTRQEGYRCWNEAALETLRHWAAKPATV
jgi:LmbE family N-acetylglucosaminyl deacetylase